jgi:hypothetical protein
MTRRSLLALLLAPFVPVKARADSLADTVHYVDPARVGRLSGLIRQGFNTSIQFIEPDLLHPDSGRRAEAAQRQRARYREFMRRRIDV